MKRALAVSGFTMLLTLTVFCNIKNDDTMSVAILASLFVFFLCLIIKPVRRNKTLPVAAISVFMALCSLFVSNSLYFKTAVLYNNREIEICGSLSELAFSDNGNTYYVIDTDTVNGVEENIKIRIVCTSPVDLEPTDTVKVTVKSFLTGQHDEVYLSYYKSINLFLTGYATSDFEITKGTHNTLADKILNLRNRMTQEVMTFMPNENGAVITGLVLGVKSDLSERATHAFSACGISHLFAVSGLHMSSWSILFFTFLRKLRVRRKTASSVSIVFCIFFMLLTGCNPPVVRAGFMMITIFMSNLFNREAEPFNSIGFALIIMLITNPYSSLSISLWLSLLATTGILTLTKPIGNTLKNPFVKIKQPLLNTVIDWIITAVSVSVAVTVFTIPVYVLKLKCISSLTILSNLIMVSIGSVCMLCGGTSMLLSVLRIDFLSKPLMIFSGLIAKFLLACSYKLSEFKFALIPVYSNYSKLLLAIFAVIIAVMLIINIKNKRVIKSVSISMAVIFVLANTVIYTLNYNCLMMTVCDVGNGTAVVLRYKGQTVLLGCGGNDYTEKTICDTMNSNGVSYIDYIILPDKSDYTAFAGEKIVNAYSVRHLLLCDSKQSARYSYKTCEVLKEKEVISLSDGEVLIAVSKAPYRCFAQIIYGKFIAVISFNYNNVLEGASGTLLVCRGRIPDGTSELNFKCVAVNTDDSSDIFQGDFSDNICSTDLNGSITFLIKSDGNFYNRREA